MQEAESHVETLEIEYIDVDQCHADLKPAGHVPEHGAAAEPNDKAATNTTTGDGETSAMREAPSEPLKKSLLIEYVDVDQFGEATAPTKAAQNKRKNKVPTAAGALIDQTTGEAASTASVGVTANKREKIGLIQSGETSPMRQAPSEQLEKSLLVEYVAVDTIGETTAPTKAAHNKRNKKVPAVAAAKQQDLKTAGAPDTAMRGKINLVQLDTRPKPSHWNANDACVECDLCGMSFWRKCMLVQHFGKQHDLLGQYSCESCTRVFRDE